MSSSPNGAGGFPLEAREITPPLLSPTRPLYWSVRRELWENRSLSIGPLLVAAVVLFGFTISTIGMAPRRRAVLLLDAAQQRATIGQPYDVAAMMLIFAAFLIGIFYCLDALHSDRRDRSIFFWKSLPVSDLTTVLSKASIPLVVLPLITFAVIVTTHFLMMLWSSVVLFGSGLAGTTWTRFHLIEQSLILLYGLIVLALWHAPIYGWLLLVSAWAKRAVFLWAVLPLLLIGIFDTIAFGSARFALLLKHRLFGGIDRAFAFKSGVAVDSVTQLTPGRFLSTPGLWIGLMLAAAFIAAAVRLRRNRQPL